MAVLTAYHGREAGWLCLSTCSLDVAVNAIVILWVTSGISDEAASRPITLPHISNSLSISSAFKEGYSLAPGALNDIPKTARKRLCSDCYAQYSIDDPSYVSEMKNWDHAVTLPLELEVGIRDVRFGLAPLESKTRSHPYTCNIPHLAYSPATSSPSDSSSEAEVKIHYLPESED